jgi:2-amino-4-hydroxy-6-hydroxymethyldihydropteridine diphosphokinase
MRCVGKFQQTATLLLGVGANVAGPWGSPGETLTRALQEIERAGVKIVAVSNTYSTKPVGDTPQPRYLNAVVLARTSIAPGTLLRLLKRIERRAGRRTARAMASRPLDLDILDYGGRRAGRPASRRERGRLILPHPEMHTRAFVLAPLLDVAPAWRHPLLGRNVKALLAQLKSADRASVRQALDSATNTCDKRVS